MAEHEKFPPEGVERTVSAHNGAVQRNAPWLLQETEAVQLVNVTINSLGARSRRLGARCFGGVHNQALPGGLNGYRDEDFDEFLVGVWDNAIFFSDLDGGWAQQACSVSLVSGLLHDIIPARHNGALAYCIATCERATDSAVGINGRSQLVVYDIENDNETAASLAPRAIETFQSRLFYGEGETVGWSEIGDLVSYSDTNNILVEPGVGGEITAIVASRDADPRLLIFKEDALFVFTPRWGTDSAIIPGAGDALDTINSSVRVLSRGVGCIATKSIAWVPGAEASDVFFLAADGVRSLQRAEQDVQTGAGFPISWNIQSWINRINFTEAHKAVAAVHDNAYHLAVPMDGAKDNTHVLRYDIANKAWTLHTWQARDLSGFKIADEDRLWMQNGFPTGDTSVTEFDTNPAQHGHLVYSLFEGNIDPTTSTTDAARPALLEESRSYTLREPMLKKRWDYFSVELSSAETSALEVAYRQNQGAWNVLTDMRVLGTASTIVFGRDPLPWSSSEEEIRRQTFSLSDIPPSYHLQIRLMTTSNSTESGRLFVYFSQVAGHLLPQEFANDP